MWIVIGRKDGPLGLEPWVMMAHHGKHPAVYETPEEAKERLIDHPLVRASYHSDEGVVCAFNLSTKETVGIVDRPAAT